MRNLKTMIPSNAPLGPQSRRWAALAVLPTLWFIARLASAQGLWIEGWQQANPVRYYPDPNDPFLIAGDTGTYIVGATNDDPDTPDYAELSGPTHDRTLHLHTEDDNMWVANISPFNLTVRAGARLALRQSGALVNPTWGGWKPFPTVSPPPGENVYLRLHDSQGNQLVYLFQRPPNYPEHSLRMDVEYPGLGIRGYREIFLGAADAAGGEYVRDLYEDLRNTPGVNPNAIVILAIEFGMNGTGDARFGPLRIGDLPTAPPIITVQPQDLSVPAGSPVTLSVQATGLGPLQYQWRKDGVPLPGASAASYTLTAATASDAGTYVVVVSNAGGSATSTPAVLRVLEAGMLGFAAATQTVSETDPVARVTVRRLAGTAGAISVFYETRTQTAVAGFDFQYRGGELKWADGDATDRFIDVPILNDTVVEPPETFEVVLAAPAGGARLGVSSAVVTIVSDDFEAPRLVGFVLRPEGRCAVRLQAVPGLGYDLEYTTDFHTWTAVRHIEVTQPETPLDLPRPEGVARAFYRAVHR